MTDLVWTPVRVKIGQIRPWQDNPRMSTKAQALRLLKSFDELGQIQTVAIGPAVDGLYPLYDGHQRVSALLTVKPDSELTALQSNRPLTEDERRKVSILLHTATGSWSWDALSSWSAAELREWGMDEDTLKGWNNDANNLKELLNAEQEEPVDAEPQIDRAAELQEKWQTASGQLWKLGDHRLLIGDCTVRENVERLMGGDRADVMLTDPPYLGTLGKGGFPNDKGLRERNEKNRENIIDLYNFDPLLFLNSIRDFCKEKVSLFFWCNKKQIPIYINFAIEKSMNWYLLSWHKKNFIPLNNNKYYPDTEYLIKISDTGACFINGIKKEDVNYGTYWIEEMGSGIDGHPTTKPLKPHLDQIQIHSNIGEIIAEPFAGSGTTIIAAHNLNRRCYAMEISPAYAGVILERFATATGITPELVKNG